MSSHHATKFWHAASSYSPEELVAKNPYGGVTSLLDWCEPNLFWPVPFIAEFWNATTNIAVVTVGLFGAYRSYKSNLDFRYILPYLALSLVGVGSFMFHGTLLFEYQLLDEVPMLIGDATFLYLVSPKEWRSTPLRHAATLLALTSYVGIVTAVYLHTGSAVFFESSFAVGALVIYLRCLNWFKVKRAESVKAQARRLLLIGSVPFLTGFILWNVENVLCNQLRDLRKAIPFALTPLTEFHALWHLGTGLGAYAFGIFCTYITLQERDIESQTSATSARAISPRRKAVIKYVFDFFPVLQNVVEDKA